MFANNKTSLAASTTETSTATRADHRVTLPPISHLFFSPSQEGAPRRSAFRPWPITAPIIEQRPPVLTNETLYQFGFDRSFVLGNSAGMSLLSALTMSINSDEANKEYLSRKRKRSEPRVYTEQEIVTAYSGLPGQPCLKAVAGVLDEQCLKTVARALDKQFKIPAFSMFSISKSGHCQQHLIARSYITRLNFDMNLFTRNSAVVVLFDNQYYPVVKHSWLEAQQKISTVENSIASSTTTTASEEQPAKRYCSAVPSVDSTRGPLLAVDNQLPVSSIQKPETHRPFSNEIFEAEDEELAAIDALTQIQTLR